MAYPSFSESKNPEDEIAHLAMLWAQRDPKPTEEEYRQAFGPRIRNCVIDGRIDEARKARSLALTDRIRELVKEKTECEEEIRRAPR